MTPSARHDQRCVVFSYPNLSSLATSPRIGYNEITIVSSDCKAAATLDMLKQYLDPFQSAAPENGAAMPVNNTIKQISDAASEKGLGEKDFFVLVEEVGKAER